MQPDFGTNLRRFIFQPNTKSLEEKVKSELLSAIRFWLPYIKVENIITDRSIENIDQYKINISLTFSVIDDIREFTTVTFRFSSDGSVAVGNL